MSDQKPLLNHKVITQLRGLTDGDDDSFLVELCERFVGNSADTLQILKDAAQHANQEHLARLAHRLCGSALNVGAVRVAAVCHEWQLRSEKGESVHLDEIEALEELLAQTREELYLQLLPQSKEQ